MPLQMYYRRRSSPPLPHPQQFSVMAELSSFSPSTHTHTDFLSSLRPYQGRMFSRSHANSIT